MALLNKLTCPSRDLSTSPTSAKCDPAANMNNIWILMELWWCSMSARALCIDCPVTSSPPAIVTAEVICVWAPPRSTHYLNDLISLQPPRTAPVIVQCSVETKLCRMSAEYLIVFLFFFFDEKLSPMIINTHTHRDTQVSKRTSFRTKCEIAH